MKRIILLISMTIFLLLCSCAANNLISDEYTHSASVVFEDSDRLREESTVTSKEPVSEETEGLAAFDNYKELIKAIESAMYDHSLIEENPNQYCEYSGTERSYICSCEFLKHLYDGSDDIAYQNLGYLIKDIDGDGVDELLLGENDSNPEKNYDGLIYDLYTYADGKIKHLFSGHPRNAFHLTENNDFVCEWSTSADTYGKIFYHYENGELKEVGHLKAEPVYVRPEFIPLGPIWKPVGNLSGDERADYVILNGLNGKYTDLSIYISGQGKIFDFKEDLGIVYVCQLAGAVDLDRDSEKEIVITILPDVNSGSLTEFIVIKKKGDKWIELENFHDDLKRFGYYSFPLVMEHDKDFKVNLSCKGLDKTVTFDVEENYDLCVQEAGKIRHADAEWDAVDYYEKKIYSTPSGTPMGRISAWGVMDVELNEYEGYPCLVALQMVEGSDKFDIWGCVDIYFDYDINGKMRVLDLKFRY